ncbi:MAG: YihY/virulence factor BrkB family protein [Eubacteriales bacterium]|nr:YihY/virulence factor BrkB family protein [Eubacteriales bacterium]
MESLHSMLEFATRVSNKMKKDRVDAYAAQSALFIIMGFMPMIMLLLTLIQYTFLTPEMVMELLVEILPESFYDLISGIVKELFTRSTALLSGTVIASVWAASRSVLSITNGLNSVRDVREDRNYFYMRFRSGMYMIFLLVAIILAIGLLLFGNQIQDALLRQFPVVGSFTGVIISMRAVISILILSLLFLAMYCALPNCRMHILRQIPGAVFTAAAWSILSYGFSIYFDHVGKTSSIYGSLTTVVMLMLWLYMCMWLLFAGAEVNCYMEYPDSFFQDELL